MSKRIWQHPEVPAGETTVAWRSAGQLEDTPAFREWLDREFPQGASVIEDEGLMQNAARTGRAFHDALAALRHDALGDIRSAGLFLGLDIVTDGQPDRDRAARLVNRLREERVLISATGPKGHVLKIRPPLVFTTDHVDIFLDRLARVLRAGV